MNLNLEPRKYEDICDEAGYVIDQLQNRNWFDSYFDEDDDFGFFAPAEDKPTSIFAPVYDFFSDLRRRAAGEF